MVSLATPEQLGAILKETIDPADGSALLILAIASGMVSDALTVQGWSLDAVVNDVVLADPVNGSLVFLEGLPVTSVSLVETFDGTVWTTVDPTMFTVSKRLGIISALPWTGVSWPTGPESWRITYSHGFTEIPMSLVGVALGVAARAWETPGGAVASETFGPHTVKYAMQASGFTPLELKALAKYANPRVA